MTGRTPADVLGKPLHEVIQDPACKAATAKTHSLASLNGKVTSFVSSATCGEGTKCRVHVSVVGTDTAAVKENRRLVTHCMVSLREECDDIQRLPDESVTDRTAFEQDDDATNARTTNLMRVVPLRSREGPNATSQPGHTMRLHCGVMG